MVSKIQGCCGVDTLTDRPLDDALAAVAFMYVAISAAADFVTLNACRCALNKS